MKILKVDRITDSLSEALLSDQRVMLAADQKARLRNVKLYA